MEGLHCHNIYEMLQNKLQFVKQSIPLEVHQITLYQVIFNSSEILPICPSVRDKQTNQSM